MKEKMTPTKFFSMFNSGKFNSKLENFMVSCSTKSVDNMERMMTWVQYNPDNKKIITDSLSNFYDRKDITKVKTQAF